MKKIIVKGLLIFSLIAGFNEAGHAQKIFVRVQPVAPVIVRPTAPSSRHVWIEGEWVWTRGHYVWKAGYWILPRPHEVWVTGHWRKAYGGWQWVPGRWKRV